MAKYHGKSGRLDFTGSGGYVKVESFTIDIVSDMAECTDMESADDWKEYVSGMKSFTISAECFVNSAADLTRIGASVASMKLYTTATKYFSFTIGAGDTNPFITSLSTTVDTEGAAKVSYEIQGCGTLNFT